MSVVIEGDDSFVVLTSENAVIRLDNCDSGWSITHEGRVIWSAPTRFLAMDASIKALSSGSGNPVTLARLINGALARLSFRRKK